MIAIVDYGVGNLFSLSSSLKLIGADAVVTNDAEVIRKADKVILPGVGAFADAAKKLQDTGLGQVVIDQAELGKPLMGICLGMQLLFERSFEYGVHDGLGLIKGSVEPISDFVGRKYKIPHIGWNALSFKGKEKDRIFKYIDEGDFVYFVHSYCGVGCDDFLIATTDYGAEITAAVANGNVYGMQFHPEKSGTVGMKILKAFCEL
ncbi:MAG: imidazole glycerol phosphate synthase subunit HisH [Ruminococcaceae bacterium]|nr:imidazole glycerol phosphate synthase subunit HisH [Oscillospiraceae bacterium]